MSEWKCQKCFITAKLHWVNSALLNQSILKEISPEYSLKGWMLKLKLQYFLATWCEEPTHWKRLWSWEVLKAGGEGDDRGWDDWMASLTQWTWIWASSRRWWRTAKPAVLQSMGLQSVGTTDQLHNAKQLCPKSAQHNAEYHCIFYRLLRQLVLISEFYFKYDAL